jgi:glycosyltransferase involved in cell wall biosynthesis/SAM-dependent methyltransferase
MHLLPGHTILELGCGDGAFTRQLVDATRNECPITAVTLDLEASRPVNMNGNVEFLALSSFPGQLENRQFDFIIAHDMLDKRCSAWLLQNIYDLLAPGGRVLFYESNPWNIVLLMRRQFMRLLGREDLRALLSRPQLYELLSEVGFIRVFAVFNDFVYSPLNRWVIWFLRNLSIVLENMPGIRRLAGSILLHAQKPPRQGRLHKASLSLNENFRQAVSVIVPCHNEELNVAPLVAGLSELFGEYICEIILVDDNSKDGTRKIIGDLAAADSRIKPVYRTPPNGVGRAIADGLRAATGDYILSLDCDFQHLLPEVRDLFDAMAQNCDMVIGSRFSRHSVLLKYPLSKIIANRAFHVLAQLALRARFRDVTNNLRLMRREVVKRLVLCEPGFAINAEIGLQPLVMGYRVKEVPLSWIGRGTDMGTSSFHVINVGQGYWRVLYGLWLRRFLGRGRYRNLVANPSELGQAWSKRVQRISTIRDSQVTVIGDRR